MEKQFSLEDWDNLQVVLKQTPYCLTDDMPFIKTSKPPSRGNLPELPDNKNSKAILLEKDYNTLIINNRDDNNTTLRPPSVFDKRSSSYSVKGGEKETDVSFGKQKWRMNAKQKAEFEAEKSIIGRFATKKSKIDSQPITGSVVIDKREEVLKMFYGVYYHIWLSSVIHKFRHSSGRC